MTFVNRIIATIIARLDTASGKPPGLIVLASRQQPSNAGTLIKVFPVNDAAADDNAPRVRIGVRRILTVAVMCRSAGTDINNEILRAWTHAQLFADETLGGVAVCIREGDTDWHGELDSKQDSSMAVMQYGVEYSRPKNTLE
jgi:hypothetical protein